jgi:hypothetical protein
VCWQCGTSRSGTRDPDFRIADDISKEELIDVVPERNSALPWRWQFRLSSVMVLTTIVAVAFALFPPQELAAIAIAIPLGLGLLLILMFAMAVLVVALTFAFGTVADFVLPLLRRPTPAEELSSDDRA